jgi:hypothetical protein
MHYSQRKRGFFDKEVQEAVCRDNAIRLGAMRELDAKIKEALEAELSSGGRAVIDSQRASIIGVDIRKLAETRSSGKWDTPG